MVPLRALSKREHLHQRIDVGKFNAPRANGTDAVEGSDQDAKVQ